MRLGLRALRARRWTEVTVGLATLGWTSQEQGVAAGRREQRQLIQSQAFTAGFQNSGTSGAGESQRTDGHLRYVEQANIVGDGGDDN